MRRSRPRGGLSGGKYSGCVGRVASGSSVAEGAASGARSAGVSRTCSGEAGDSRASSEKSSRGAEGCAVPRAASGVPAESPNEASYPSRSALARSTTITMSSGHKTKSRNRCSTHATPAFCWFGRYSAPHASSAPTETPSAGKVAPRRAPGTTASRHASFQSNGKKLCQRRHQTSDSSRVRYSQGTT